MSAMSNSQELVMPLTPPAEEVTAPEQPPEENQLNETITNLESTLEDGNDSQQECGASAQGTMEDHDKAESCAVVNAIVDDLVDKLFKEHPEMEDPSFCVIDRSTKGLPKTKHFRYTGQSVCTKPRIEYESREELIASKTQDVGTQTVNCELLVGGNVPGKANNLKSNVDTTESGPSCRKQFKKC